jgi:hypothetical protein
MSALTVLERLMTMVGRLVNDELERIWKEAIVVYSRYYSGIYV